MWQDMGDVPPDLFEPLRAKAKSYIREALASGDYVGSLATSRQRPKPSSPVPGFICATQCFIRSSAAALQLESREARLGTVLNVFTEPEWRRRGVAGLLMQRIINWSRDAGLDGLTLHAADAGRTLYEKLGFVATNEMRLAD